MSDLLSPPSYNSPSLSFDSNPIDLQKEQETLRNLREQRKQLEIQTSSSIPSVQNDSNNLFSFENNSIIQSNQNNSEKQFIDKFSQFMSNVESKLDLLSNSVRQLDIDIQLSVNKQDKDLERISSSIKDIEIQYQTQKQQMNNNSNSSSSVVHNPIQSNSNSFNNQEQINLSTSPNTNNQNVSSLNNNNNNLSSNSRPTCPVCSLSFSASEIHAHIESHFNDGHSVEDNKKENQPGFWSKLFKSNSNSNSNTNSSSQQQQEIRPPTYNYAPPNNNPSNVQQGYSIPAFNSPSGTVQYVMPNNNQQIYQQQQQQGNYNPSNTQRM